MILYHGSTLAVEKPDIAHSREAVDFGKGFYTTPLKGQAKRWAARFVLLGKPGIVSKYTLNEEAFKVAKVLEFKKYTEEWLDFIVACRGRQDHSDYDIIIGGVANDNVFNTIQLYRNGYASKADTIKQLMYEKPNLQICFRTQDIIDRYLHYEGSERL